MNRSKLRLFFTPLPLASFGIAAFFLTACDSELTAPSESALAVRTESPVSGQLALAGSDGQLGAIRSLESSTASASVIRGFLCQVTPDGLTTTNSVATFTSSGGETLFCRGWLSPAPESTTTLQNPHCTLYTGRTATRSRLVIASSGSVELSCSR